jgi:hypothetical protein
MYGNPKKYYMNEDIGECDPNSIKYVYFGLLNIQQILQIIYQTLILLKLVVDMVVNVLFY